MLICELPDGVQSDDDDVIDDVIDRPTRLQGVSIVTSHCKPARNILLPVDLRQRRRRRKRQRYNNTGESQNSTSNEYRVDFAVCVPPLYGKVRTTALVEFIEVNYMKCESRKSSWGFLTFSPKWLGILIQILHAHYTLPSTLDHTFLFNYLQL